MKQHPPDGKDFPYECKESRHTPERPNRHYQGLWTSSVVTSLLSNRQRPFSFTFFVLKFTLRSFVDKTSQLIN